VITIDKKILYTLLRVALGGLLLGGVFLAGYLYGRRTDVPDNGDGADAVRENIGAAAAYNREADRQAELIETQRERSESAVTGSIGILTDNEKRIDAIAAGLGELRELAAESQSVIDGIRKRNEAENQHP
jgi:hypothetical protein